MRAPLIALLFFASVPFTLAQPSVSLLENSPFAPPGRANSSSTNADAGPASLAKLQLRGITSIDGEYIFSVYNPDTRESKWIPQGESQDGLMIKSFNPEGNSVVIHSESENLSRQLKMNEYSASTALRAIQTPARPSAQPARTSITSRPVSPTGTLTRTQQTIQRPTRRNLETLRERRAELAEKLRKQPKPGGSTNQPQSQKKDQAPNRGGSGNSQGNGGKR